MGAIAGLFYPAAPKPVDAARVRAMADAMAHRGPDGAGTWTGMGIGLAHRRLAIIDPAGSSQPMLTGDRRYAIVLDGGIFNHRELRDELTAAGRRFVTDGDAEVLLQGFAAWGPSVLERLDGTFACAIHDTVTQTLFLARDRLGAKPLHVAELSDGALAFASELKGLLAHPLLRRTPDIRAAEEYLAFGHVPDDACLVAGVRKLAAGHFLLAERGRTASPPRRWWPFRGDATSGGEALLTAMQAAVRAGMQADVPVGAMLSGDPADAAAVALMAEASPRAVTTCATGPADAAQQAAMIAAQHFATRHRTLQSTYDPVALLPPLVHAFDEPFGDPAAVPALHAALFARESMTVAIAGTGAAALAAAARRHAAFARTVGWHAAFSRLRRRPDGDAGQRYARTMALVSSGPPAALWSDAGRGLLDGYRAERRYERVMRGITPAEAAVHARRVDLDRLLPGLLARVDRIGMAAGLEIRAPWLDPRVIEAIAVLPPSRQAPDRRGRGPIERAAARYFPSAVPAVGPASPPVAAWFRGPLSEQAALLSRSRILAELGWFDHAQLARLVDEHRSGRADHGRWLWQLLMLERSLTRLFG